MCVMQIPLQLGSAGCRSLHSPRVSYKQNCAEAKTKFVSCSKFPKISVVLEQFHVFKTCIIAEFTVRCKIHKDFLLIEREYFIKT